MRQDLPVGTVTFLFTDIEGSTRLLEELGSERYGQLLAQHHRVCRVAWVEHGGVEVDTAGDAFFVAFPTASGALAAAAEAQLALAELGLRVRMGVHTGEVSVNETGYLGLEVHRAARIAAAAHGGQVVVSASTAALVGRDGLVDLGEHRFKDLAAAERVFQLGEGEFPPLKSLYRSNLPVPATPFLGRERELHEVVELLARPDPRVLTLIGPGGTGKTRLALQAAAAAADEFPDGVFWVPLAPLRDPALVLPGIAHALEVREQADRSLLDSLGDALAGKNLLLLLDNAEHLLPEAALELAALIGTCPTVRMLVTSRERLRLQAEHLYEVSALEEGDAVELFLARTAALGVILERTSAVEALCHRLEGLPLALELAAARTRVFSVEQLVDRIGERLDLLKGARDADPRQQTLRATIEWSYDLLDESEQSLLRAFSVFAGGCTYEAAEFVCDADPDSLQSLIDKSLVRVRTGTGGTQRYWMLETIREYGQQRAREAAETEQLAQRHLAWFVSLAEENGIDVVDPDANKLISSNAAAATERVEGDFANIRGALAHALDLHEPDHVGRVVAPLFPFLIVHGHLAEARQWVEAALEQREHLSNRGLANVRLGGGEIVRFAGDMARARELKREALVVLGDDRELAPWAKYVLADLCDIALEDGDFELARRYAAESALAGGGTRAAGSLAEVFLRAGELESAESQGLLALAGVDEGEMNHAAALETLAEIARRQGDAAKAYRRFTDALRAYSDLGDGGGVADCLDGLARLAAGAGDAERAGCLRGAAQNLREAWGRMPARADLPWPVLSDDALSRGAAMSLEEAVAYALAPFVQER